MRAIDADRLIDDLKHDVVMDQDSLDYEELTDSNREKIQFDKDCKQNAIDLLQNAPTIEPHCETCEAFNKTRLLIPQRKKGKWLYDEERCATGIYAICSACNESIYQTGNFRYCPNCGARMEGEG